MADRALVTSRMGLGLAAAGRPAYINSGRDHDLGARRSVDDLRALSHALLDTAYAGGVRYIDVARSYGRAEEFLAGWLDAHPEASDVIVGSKWGYRFVGEWRMDAAVHEVKDHSRAAFTQQWPLSRGLLGDRLSIYHVHSLTPDSPALADEALHEALAVLRDSGVRVGFSTSGPAQAEVIRRALTVDVGGRPLFSSVEATWNLLETSAGPALSEAADAGLTVILKEVVANGRLTSPGTDPLTSTDPLMRAARELARMLGAGIDQIAVAAALAQPWAWRVLSGAVTQQQLTQNLAGEALPLDAAAFAALGGMALPPAQYWAERSQRPWS